MNSENRIAQLEKGLAASIRFGMNGDTKSLQQLGRNMSRHISDETIKSEIIELVGIGNIFR